MTEQGREQTCRHCRITEAKGSYCTRCLRPTKPDWIHKSRKGNSGRFRSNEIAAGGSLT
jgi:methionyl-tRNA synthetase